MSSASDHRSKISIERMPRASQQRSRSGPNIPVVRVTRHGSLMQTKPKRRNQRRRRIVPTLVDSNDVSSYETTSVAHTDSILIKEEKHGVQDGKLHREVTIGSLSSVRMTDFDTTDQRRPSSERKRRRRRRGFCWICPWPCCILCYTLLLLLCAIGLTALFISLPKKTTTKITSETATSITSISTTSMTSSSSSTTTISSTSSTSTTSTTSSSTSTSTTSTTTTTRTNCGSSCVNQTWISSANLLAKWLFDGSLDDQTTVHNATGVNNPIFPISYVNLGISLDVTLNQSLFAAHLPLSNSSFTITAWINVTSYPNPIFHSLLGICTTTAPGKCLNVAIREDAGSYFLYMDFFGSSCQGNTNILSNAWYHVGFVFDLVTMTQSIYLDGVLDQTCSAVSSPLVLAPTTLTTIGSIPLLIPLNGTNLYHGLIDQLIVSGRVKSSCELFEEAALVARFEFDNPLADQDLGPNNLPGYGSQYTFVPSSRSPQGISFGGNNQSHFTIEGVSVLGITNHSFSIVYWMQTANRSGSILHLSSWSDGRGWCMPYMGFNINGSIFAEVLSGGGVKAIAAPDMLPTQSWSHVAQTWSQTNGLRLYINATLVASNTSLSFNTASGVPMYVFLGSGVMGLFHCAKGALPSKIPFPGAIDDFRIYSRELTAIDICTILFDS